MLHSFYLPQFRIKQDAVPGLTIPVWFDSDRAGEFELVCAELCGWGHYKMRGKVTVHETQVGLRRMARTSSSPSRTGASSPWPTGSQGR